MNLKKTRTLAAGLMASVAAAGTLVAVGASPASAGIYNNCRTAAAHHRLVPQVSSVYIIYFRGHYGTNGGAHHYHWRDVTIRRTNDTFFQTYKCW